MKRRSLAESREVAVFRAARTRPPRVDGDEVSAAVPIQVRDEHPRDGPALVPLEGIEGDGPESPQPVVQDGRRREAVGREDQVQVAVVIQVEGGHGDMRSGPAEEVGCVFPRGERDRQALGGLQLVGPAHAWDPAGFGRRPGHRGGPAVVAKGSIREARGLSIREGIFGPGRRREVDDIKVQVAVLVQVKPAGRRAHRQRSGLAQGFGDILEFARPQVPQQAIVPHAGQEKVNKPVGVEVARGDTQARSRRGQAGGFGGVLESPVAPVEEQGVAQATRPDDCGGEEQILPAVTVRIERGDRRTEPGPRPAQEGMRAV